MDGSLVSLVAITSQVNANTKEGLIGIHASRSLTETEQRHTQTERKAHVVVWACEHRHLYMYGKLITVYNDHKPSVSIYENKSSKPPTRIELWSFRLPS